MGLERHWEPARVEAELTDAKRIKVTTKNVSEFAVGMGLPDRERVVTVDGMELSFRGLSDQMFHSTACLVRIHKQAGKWTIGSWESIAGLAKRPNLQGPIDDAFMDSFVMVRPTGQPLNAAVGQWAKTELAEAAFHWRRYFRGEPRVKDDSAITDDDLKSSHLVLWGDPSSNQLLARIADKLPIQWNGKFIQVGKQSFDATKHVPVFIFPNPLNPSRYVVINSGFTFPQFAAASNSLQTPKLPDWAVLDMSVPLAERVAGKGVIAADFFGEKWEVK